MTLLRECRCATSWYDLDLTFDLGIVTLTYKILSGLYISETVRCRKMILVGILVRVVDMTFDLVIVTMSFKILSGLFLGFHKV